MRDLIECTGKKKMISDSESLFIGTYHTSTVPRRTLPDIDQSVVRETRVDGVSDIGRSPINMYESIVIDKSISNTSHCCVVEVTQCRMDPTIEEHFASGAIHIDLLLLVDSVVWSRIEKQNKERIDEGKVVQTRIVHLKGVRIDQSLIVLAEILYKRRKSVSFRCMKPWKRT